MHTACVPFCRGNPSYKVCTVCVCVCLGLARMMLEGKRFFRPSLVVAIVVVGLPGHQSCLPASLPACQPSCQSCLFQAFNYVCLEPGPDTHTHTLAHWYTHNQAHTKTWQKFCNARRKGHARCWSVSVAGRLPE